jgi:hypothetical protein
MSLLIKLHRNENSFRISWSCSWSKNYNVSYDLELTIIPNIYTNGVSSFTVYSFILVKIYLCTENSHNNLTVLLYLRVYSKRNLYQYCSFFKGNYRIVRMNVLAPPCSWNGEQMSWHNMPFPQNFREIKEKDFQT